MKNTLATLCACSRTGLRGNQSHQVLTIPQGIGSQHAVRPLLDDSSNTPTRLNENCNTLAIRENRARAILQSCLELPSTCHVLQWADNKWVGEWMLSQKVSQQLRRREFRVTIEISSSLAHGLRWRCAQKQDDQDQNLQILLGASAIGDGSMWSQGSPWNHRCQCSELIAIRN